jgi:hypothetical protein
MHEEGKFIKDNLCDFWHYNIKYDASLKEVKKKPNFVFNFIFKLLKSREIIQNDYLDYSLKLKTKIEKYFAGLSNNVI